MWLITPFSISIYTYREWTKANVYTLKDIGYNMVYIPYYIPLIQFI